MRAVLSWLGADRYQADIIEAASATSAFLLVQVYETVYNLGSVPVGVPTEVEIPANVPYGPMRVGAVAANGELTARWSYTIREGHTVQRNFMAQLRRRTVGLHPMTHRRTGYRMRVDVVATRGLSPDTGNAIFLFRRNRDAEHLEGDEFMCVCHPGDLEEYPKDAPFEDGVFYRKNYVDLIDISPIRIAALWRGLKNDTDRLMATLESNTVLSEEEIVVCHAGGHDNDQ